jgi:K+-sensing histidine kinase KdpD/DNA-binding response OmpR family regulator/ligand-binding sensor domain-containing protein
MGKNRPRRWKCTSAFHLPIKTFILFAFILLPRLLTAQISAEQGLPFVTNFSPKAYSSYPQTWAAIQDDKGLMYFGNQGYILQYDGVRWQKINCARTGTVAIRSLAKNKKGIIYYAAIGDFGYLDKDSLGRPKAHSLLDYIPDSLRNFNDIWSVYVTDEGVYFQARERIFRLKENSEGKPTGEINWWNPTTKFMYAFYLDGVYYMHQQGLGLFKMVNDVPELIPGSEFLGNERIQVMLPYPEDNKKEYLIGMFYSGLYIYDGKNFRRFPVQADSLLKATLYKAALLNDGSYALATAGKGLVIMDKDGKTMQVINRAAGLQDESVYAVYPDNSGNVWMGLDNGISKIETASPLTQFTIQSGITTASLCVQRFDGSIYLGTTNGLLRLNDKTNRFEQIKNIYTNQVFAFWEDNDEMIVATDGLYSVKGQKVKLIHRSISGNMQLAALYMSKRYPNVLFTGESIQGLAVFTRKSSKNPTSEWKFKGYCPGVNQQGWTFAEDSAGNIWEGTQNEVVYRITPKFDNNGDLNLSKSTVEKFGKENGLGSGCGPVFAVNGKVYFSADSSFYRFDEQSKRFERDSTFGSFPNAGGKDEVYMVEDYAGRVWVRFGKEAEIAVPQPDGRYKINKTALLPISDRTISQFYPEKNGIVWICTTDGLVRFDERLKKDYDQPFKTLLRSITAGDKTWNPDIDESDQKNTEVASTNNSLRFEYASPFFEQEEKTQYQTWLEGFEKDWSNWGHNYYKEYTNLPPGKYTFHVRAKNIFQKISNEAVYGFTVNPPWYQTWWAYLLYAVIIVGIVYMIIRYRTAQLHAKHRQLEKTVSERTSELQQRVQELAVINSVQEALVSALGIQEIYDLVGDRLRNVFNAQAVIIASLDQETGLEHFKYTIENGQRFYPDPRPFDKLRHHLIKTKQKIVINNSKEAFDWFAKAAIPGTKQMKSGLFVPLTIGDKITSYVSLQNVDKETAFNSSDIKLLETLANSMSVALENARLFDETQRLLKETEQRNAELAVINSVQEGLVAQMDMQAIYNLVGDKIQEIFDAQAVVIRTFDKKSELEYYYYIFEKGERLYLDPHPLTWSSRELLRNGQTLFINQNYGETARRFGESGVIIGEVPKSALFVPMMVGASVKGSISVQNVDHENAFNDSDLRLLTTLANSMSVSLENARLFEETKTLLAETEKGKKNVELLSDIGKEITASLDFETIFYKLYEHINQLADATIFGVGIYQAEQSQIEYKFAIEKGIRYAPYKRSTKDKNQFPVWCIENRQPVFINDVRKEYSKYIHSYNEKPLLLEDGTYAQEAESMIYLPLVVQQRILGIITIQSFQKNAYTDYHLNLLQNLATYTSIAFDNANAYRQLNEREHEITQRAAELSTVNSISQALASKLELDALIQLVGDQIRNLFRANIVYVALLDKKSNLIRFPYQYGEDLPPLKFGEGLSSKIILSGESLLINKDVEERTSELGVHRIGIPAASYLGVPIPVGDEIIGVLSVQTTQQENRFTEKDQRLLSTIAAHVGVALRKARLFEEVKQANLEADAARKTAEQANAAKSAFLSTVSHELRTPLTSVLGFAKIIKKRLEEKVFPATDQHDAKMNKTISQISENLNVVIAEGERLTNLINDVLDLAKIEAGKMEWNMESLSISDVLDRAVAATSSLFMQKNLQLDKEVQPGLPMVSGDKDKLIQVMVNLLSNAVKFTNQGSVVCHVSRKKDEIIVSVTDTGIGIAPEDHAAVFEQFKQVGDTLTDKPKGTGLGLPICKEIIEHHGGRIWLESELGKGSTFFFSLPLIPERSATIKPIHFDDLVRQLKQQVAQSRLNLKGSNPSVLIVDDDASIRSLLRQELGEAGYLTEEAENGQEALAHVRERRPDLIILDVMMPEMSGFDVAAILKNDPETMDIPIIILSVVQDKSRGYRIGVDRYLTKPINTQELFSEVGSLLEQGKSHKKVMVVDEDTTTVHTLADVLHAQGYQVVESDGKELVEKAISSQPDIIILNSVLSGKQEIVQTLRFEKGLENVVFLVYQ